MGASLLTMVVNGDAGYLDARGVWAFIASKPAPTMGIWVHPKNQVDFQAVAARNTPHFGYT